MTIGVVQIQALTNFTSIVRNDSAPVHHINDGDATYGVCNTYTVLHHFGTTPVAYYMPNPSRPGVVVTVKDIAGNSLSQNVTILPFSSELIDGNLFATIDVNFACMVFVSDGTNWRLSHTYNGTFL